MTDSIKKSTTQPLASQARTVAQRNTSPATTTAGKTSAATGKLTTDSNAAPKLASNILDRNLAAVQKGADTLDNVQTLREGLEDSESSIDAAAKMIQGSLGMVSTVAEGVSAAKGGGSRVSQSAEKLSAAKGRVDSAVNVLEGGKQVMEGIQQLSEGNLEGVISLGEGVVNFAQGTGETVANAGQVARGLGADSNRLVKLADRVGSHLQDGARVSRALSVGGSVFGGLGGGAAILKGISAIRQGDRAAGIGQVVSGASNVAESVSGLTSVLATKGSLAARLGGTLGSRVVPILGVAGGLVQVGAAVTKTPPDTKAAATGAMSTVGSVLMPFPPVGTAVGGALVVGAAVIDNWDTISGAASKAGSFVKGLFS